MTPNNSVIVTEDGQRLTIEEGTIAGAEKPAQGLAYETGNVLDEENRADNEGGGACSVPTGKTEDTLSSGKAGT